MKSTCPKRTALGPGRRRAGYVNLSTYTQDAGENVANALRAMKNKDAGLKGVILDLRGNGGGLLNEAVNLVNVFVPQGDSS